jgi:adenylate cyclase
MKRQIAYFGDTMNVAARLCDHCKTADEALLVSADLLRASVTPPGFCIGAGASIALRGRQAPVDAHPVRRIAPASQRA